MLFGAAHTGPAALTLFRFATARTLDRSYRGRFSAASCWRTCANQRRFKDSNPFPFARDLTTAVERWRFLWPALQIDSLCERNRPEARAICRAQTRALSLCHGIFPPLPPQVFTPVALVGPMGTDTGTPLPGKGQRLASGRTASEQRRLKALYQVANIASDPH